MVIKSIENSAIFQSIYPGGANIALFNKFSHHIATKHINLVNGSLIIESADYVRTRGDENEIFERFISQNTKTLTSIIPSINS